MFQLLTAAQTLKYIAYVTTLPLGEAALNPKDWRKHIESQIVPKIEN
jgi:hypothetical protein